MYLEALSKALEFALNVCEDSTRIRRVSCEVRGHLPQRGFVRAVGHPQWKEIQPAGVWLPQSTLLNNWGPHKFIFIFVQRSRLIKEPNGG